MNEPLPAEVQAGDRALLELADLPDDALVPVATARAAVREVAGTLELDETTVAHVREATIQM